MTAGASLCRRRGEAKDRCQTQQPQGQVSSAGSVLGRAAALGVLGALGGRLQPQDSPHQPRLGGQAVIRR